MKAGVLVRARFDPATTGSVSLAIVDALSYVTDDLVDLPPLADAVDTDAIESLFTPRFGLPPSKLTLTFPYEEWTITLTGTGEVLVSCTADSKQITH